MSLSQSTIEEHILSLEDGSSLNEQEKKVFEMIRTACESFAPKIVIARVAGGWVRDKLLGLESDDLDITLDGSYGREFGAKLQEIYPSTHMNSAQNEKSKHLEVAKIKMFDDFWVDICNLRSEEYTSSTRVPIVGPGTLQDDAKRRDFTINALFFNINESKVEDIVGGIPDLLSNVLKTPIDPFKSFEDDPLRILRGIRFSTRFGMRLDPTILSSMPSSLDSFRTKITQERAENELSKMFYGNDPISSVEILSQIGFFQTIFDPQQIFNLNEAEAISRLKHILHFSNNHNEKYAQVLAAIYSPLGITNMVTDPQNPKKKWTPIEYAAVRVFKANLQVGKIANAIVLGMNTMPTLLQNLNRLSVAHWIRECGQYYILAIYFPINETLNNFAINELLPFIQNNGLENVWSLKPLLSGKLLAQIHNVQPGKGMNELVRKLIDWQIENPNGTVDDYKTFIYK